MRKDRKNRVKPVFIPDSSFICVFNCMYTSIIIQYSQGVSCAGNQITMNENIQDIMQAKLFSGLSQKMYAASWPVLRSSR